MSSNQNPSRETVPLRSFNSTELRTVEKSYLEIWNGRVVQEVNAAHAEESRQQGKVPPDWPIGAQHSDHHGKRGGRGVISCLLGIGKERMRKPKFAPGESLIRNKIQGCAICQQRTVPRRYGGPVQQQRTVPRGRDGGPVQGQWPLYTIWGPVLLSLTARSWAARESACTISWKKDHTVFFIFKLKN
jgi:hypothetical protein